MATTVQGGFAAEDVDGGSAGTDPHRQRGQRGDGEHPGKREGEQGSAHQPGACAARTCTYGARTVTHVKEHRSASVLLAGLAAVLDVSGRRRTVMDDRRRRPGTELRRELRRELRLEPNDARPPNGSGNGHRRRSERWRWDLNPRESYPSTRFRGVLLWPLGHATVGEITRVGAPQRNRGGSANTPAREPHRSPRPDVWPDGRARRPKPTHRRRTSGPRPPAPHGRSGPASTPLRT